jgi:hypothetical protein
MKAYGKGGRREVEAWMHAFLTSTLKGEQSFPL